MQMSKWLVLLLTFPAAAFAQQQQQREVTTSSGKMILDLSPGVASGCPVGLMANRQGPGPAMWTTAQEDTAAPWNGARPRPTDVGVHVKLIAPLVRTMKQVELSVAYLPYGVHYTPVQQNKSVSTYYRKTFELVAEGDASKSLEGNLLVGMASGVTRVYVTRVIYTDGTEWSPLDGKSCGVEPSGLMLVDGK